MFVLRNSIIKIYIICQVDWLHGRIQALPHILIKVERKISCSESKKKIFKVKVGCIQSCSLLPVGGFSKLHSIQTIINGKQAQSIVSYPVYYV